MVLVRISYLQYDIGGEKGSIYWRLNSGGYHNSGELRDGDEDLIALSTFLAGNENRKVDLKAGPAEMISSQNVFKMEPERLEGLTKLIEAHNDNLLSNPV